MVVTFGGTGDFPGSVTVKNLKSGQDSTMEIGERQPAGAAASTANIACAAVGVRCALQQTESLKVCGAAGDIEVDATQLNLTKTDFQND